MTAIVERASLFRQFLVRKTFYKIGQSCVKINVSLKLTNFCVNPIKYFTLVKSCLNSKLGCTGWAIRAGLCKLTSCVLNDQAYYDMPMVVIFV